MRVITVCRFYFLDTRWSVALKDSFEDEVNRAWRDDNHTSNRPTRECLVSGVWGTGFECFLEYPCGNGSLRFACL